ncbi:MAG TPA: hypothetical protein VNT51_09175 [Miltoncostaeaceae bacterium]|nr:hypothetical protein [Miltoncostaeaceae bacterium]
MILPPQLLRRPSRTPRLGLAVLLLLVFAHAAAAQAPRPPGDVFGAINDPAGDVTLSSDPARYESPDVRSVTAAYLDISTKGPEDDVVQASAVVDAGPASGIEPRIYPNRVLAWWLDTDGDPATGYDEPGFGLGADHLVVAYGQSDGRPTTAWLRSWGGTDFRTVRLIALVPTGNAFAWSLPAASIGAARGQRLGVSVEAAAIVVDRGTVIKSDRAPDDGRPMVLPVPPPPPAVVAASAPRVEATRAVISGVIDDGGADAQWFVRYGVKGLEEGVTPPRAVSASGRSAVEAELDGLLPGTAYRYQLVVRTAWGETPGEVLAFTTPPAPAAATRRAQTGPARAVTATAARLTGTVAATGAPRWFFEWGPTPRYGRRTPMRTLPRGPASVAAALRALPPDRVVHYRLVVIADGTRHLGEDARLRTARAGRLAVAGDARAACTVQGCRLRTLTVRVRGRDPGGRVLRGTALRRGTQARVRCVRGCRLAPRTVPLSGSGRTLSADVAALLPGKRVPAGGVVEVRVLRPGYLGAVYRTRATRQGLAGRVCGLSADGRGGCARP